MMQLVSSPTRALAAAERSPLSVCRKATSTHASTPTSSPLVSRPQPRQLASISARKLQAVRSSRSVLAAAAAPLYDIYVKGAPVEGLVNEKGELGDCEPGLCLYLDTLQFGMLGSDSQHDHLLIMQALSRKGQ